MKRKDKRMRTVDALALVPEDKIAHKHYGVCTVVSVMRVYGKGLFGVVLNPDTREGQKLLARHSGTEIFNVLEDSVRQMQLINATK